MTRRLLCATSALILLGTLTACSGAKDKDSTPTPITSTSSYDATKDEDGLPVRSGLDLASCGLPAFTTDKDGNHSTNTECTTRSGEKVTFYRFSKDEAVGMKKTLTGTVVIGDVWAVSGEKQETVDKAAATLKKSFTP